MEEGERIDAAIEYTKITSPSNYLNLPANDPQNIFLQRLLTKIGERTDDISKLLLDSYVNQTINKKRTVTFQDHKNKKTLVLHSKSGLTQGDGLSPGLFSLSHVDRDKLLIEEHKEVAQYYFADNVDAVGRYDKVLVWAKDYINT
jgi:hypothetical protein